MAKFSEKNGFLKYKFKWQKIPILNRIANFGDFSQLPIDLSTAFSTPNVNFHNPRM